MTRDDVIRMAREAWGELAACMNEPQLLRFAALVAAAEREACVQIINTYQFPVGNSAAGEMAAEWTRDALIEVRDSISARGKA